MKKNLILVVISILVLSLNVFASGPVEEIDEYIYGGTLHLARFQAPEGMFNPILSETVYDNDIWELVFDGLITTNKYFEPVPKLAEKWEISDDNLTYTFYLKKGVLFHDGHELTTEDVYYTLMTILHPDYPGVRASNFMTILGAEEYKAGKADTVEGIKVIDDYTISITLKEVTAPFLVSAMYMGILPAHILKDVPVADIDKIEFNRKPIGTGPFKFVEYVTDQYCKLAAFEDYHNGRPYLDYVIYHYLGDDARLIKLEKGEIDWAEIPGYEFEKVKKMENVTLHKQIRNGYGYIGFRVANKDSVVSNKIVRQAIAYGINRQGFVDKVMNGFAIVPNSPISQASWAYANPRDLNQYPYNPKKARELLESDGWKFNKKTGYYEKDGKVCEFELMASSGSEFIDQLMALVQDNLREVGIKVNLVRLEFNAMREKINAGEYEATFMGWSLGADPDPYNVWHSKGSWNRTGYSNPEADKLIEAARATLDRAERKNYYVKWQKIMNEDLPYIYMYANTYIHAVNKRVRGFDPNPLAANPFWRGLEHVWIPKEFRRK
ncbi:hypothetical protein BBF96_03820 [Anoxybacter fermentans]|uniref:Solute-binding protein family 5 domain-containing protein n=1 Tax=Anoxybacter fermentans TaxID=1323375 RepID=A0A3Q9HP94_9FIRM|nr:peptide-binding protein [Anoxybacter fermentans]AZR72589.1 hypothetical protein BBF96_03820 [Anoxybacter fermentans]